MTEQTTLPKDDPRMVAWEAYKRTDEYFNTKQWATVPEHTEGSLWAAFVAGFTARASSPTPRSGAVPTCPKCGAATTEGPKVAYCSQWPWCGWFAPLPAQPSGGVPTSVPTLAEVERAEGQGVENA